VGRNHSCIDEFLSVARKPEAAHRGTLEPSCQLLTLRGFHSHSGGCGLSMVLAVPRLRPKLVGRSSRLVVEISDRPSRRLAAATRLVGTAPIRRQLSLLGRCRWTCAARWKKP
jgi:hypothetical protein